MIVLFGTLYNVVGLPSIDHETKAETITYTAEILHSVKGKTEIASVKLDGSVVDGWKKATGKEISCEVRFYAMKNREGGIQSGLTLADKKAFPNHVQKAA